MKEDWNQVDERHRLIYPARHVVLPSRDAYLGQQPPSDLIRVGQPLHETVQWCTSWRAALSVTSLYAAIAKFPDREDKNIPQPTYKVGFYPTQGLIVGSRARCGLR